MKERYWSASMVVLAVSCLLLFSAHTLQAADFFVQPCANDTDFATSLYRSILQREPDAEGHRNWVNSMRGGMAREEVIRRFFSSPEYQGLRRSNRDYATDLYLSILGREPDKEGHVNWKQSLNSGMSRSEVLERFFQSPEYRGIKGGCR
jgi:hypothetical protein